MRNPVGNKLGIHFSRKSITEFFVGKNKIKHTLIVTKNFEQKPNIDGVLKFAIREREM